MTDPAPTDRAPVEVVVVGASAGGVGALQRLVGRLPGDLRAVLLVVLHIPTTGTSALAGILQRRSALNVARAEDGAPLEFGSVLVAPPDRHLRLDGAVARLSREARVNGHRPAIDPLFESAGRWFGERTLGVLLSGTLDDGVAGLAAIRDAGGLVAVQDPHEADYPGMPRAAIEAGVVHHVLPLDGIAELICGSTDEGSPGMTHPHPGPPRDGRAAPPRGPSHARPPEARSPDGELAVVDDPHESRPDQQQAGLSCPSCGGTLWEGHDGGVAQFECRVGHRYSPASLFAAQGDALEDALWAAHRALLERADLARRMARRMHRGGGDAAARRYERLAEETDARADVLRRSLTRVPPEAEDIRQAAAE